MDDVFAPNTYTSFMGLREMSSAHDFFPEESDEGLNSEKPFTGAEAAEGLLDAEAPLLVFFRSAPNEGDFPRDWWPFRPGGFTVEVRAGFRALTTEAETVRDSFAPPAFRKDPPSAAEACRMRVASASVPAAESLGGPVLGAGTIWPRHVAAFRRDSPPVAVVTTLAVAEDDSDGDELGLVWGLARTRMPAAPW